MSAEPIREERPSPASLLDELHSHDAAVAMRARAELVGMGDAAVPYLIGLLSDLHANARWEAARALAELAPPEAAPALVRALVDEDGGIRWLAADTLARCGLDALDALLHELLRHSESTWLREGAHHILTDMAHARTLPRPAARVLEALEEVEPRVGVMQAAARALDELHLHRYAR